jgi:2-polyprenyl-6-hydroxyphenyl methylase/3-demethylubiquinone-9 3-methyltransferase
VTDDRQSKTGSYATDVAGFSFGENWEMYVKRHLSDERVEISRAHLMEFLGRDTLAGCTFLDIGCGSGIHSLAALRSGAQRVISFDADPSSVAATRKVFERCGDPQRMQVLQGSILDDELVARLPKADIVYSWGLLHHTGDLWSAMRNAASLVADGGTFYIAVYEKTDESEYWIATKQRYNRAGWLQQRLMELACIWRLQFRTTNLGAIWVSLRHILSYKRSRGMAYLSDIRDWLGGWPFEPATEAEVCTFCEKELGLERIKVRTGEANIEYLFNRPDSQSLDCVVHQSF